MPNARLHDVVELPYFCAITVQCFCLCPEGGMCVETSPVTSQSLLVYRAAEFVVSEGVAEGDSLSFADELVMDDTYQINACAKRERLSLVMGARPRTFTIDEGSPLGTAGCRVFLDSCLTLMVPDGSTCELLIFVEIEAEEVAEIYMLPLVTLIPDTDYRLVGIDRVNPATRLAEVACVSFSRGTHITMASGEQRRIEELRVGDRILTRDDGPQELRWIGQTTVRASGEMAPVVIRKGALHNQNDLLLSPEHRIFVYQREDRLGAGRSEVLVKVRHLVNGTSVVQVYGGFMEYYQLLFDQHQIIYAEGIAAESLLIDQRTRPALPPDATQRGRHDHRAHLNYEVSERLFAGGDAIEKLRLASRSN
jgi:hypothetical protein